MANWIEITTKIGCKNMCSYCPQSDFLNVYKDVKKTMSIEDFKMLISNVNKDIQIHFSGFSESMLNDESIDMMIHAWREGYEVVLYSTLVGFTLEKAIKLRDSGMIFNHTRLHEFDGIGFDKQEFDEKCKMFIDNVKTRDHHVFRVLNPTSRGGHLRNIGRKYGRIRCGGNRVFNNVLLPNGDVFLCCSDWSLKHKIGNLYKNHYASEEFNLARTSILQLQEPQDSDVLCRTCEDSFNY